MATNYHQLSLKDTFSDCNDMFMDDVPSFFSFWISILIFLFLFHIPFKIPFISILVEKERILLPVFFRLSSYKKSSPFLQMLC